MFLLEAVIMRTGKIHFFILIISLIICCFIFLETYLLPFSERNEEVRSLREKHSRKKFSSDDNYFMETETGEYLITGSIYGAVSIGDTVVMRRAPISGSLQEISLPKENLAYNYFTGFARIHMGIIFLPLAVLGIFCMLIFYKRIDSMQGRTNLSFALFIIVIIMLFFHINP